MFSRTALVLALGFLPLVAACSNDDEEPATAPAASSLEVTGADPNLLTRETTTEKLSGSNSTGTDCEDIAAAVAPVAVQHLDVSGAEQPDMQQTAGQATVTFFGAAGPTTKAATFVATIVGKAETGEPLGNHNMLFADGTLRTLGDHNYLTPTSDPCIFDVKATLAFHDGTGAYAGMSGTGVANGKVNFCGTPGLIYAYARLCKK